MFKAFINLDFIFRQNLFPKLVIARDNARFRIENFYSNFDTFVICTLMGNKPWPQFQSGIRERLITGEVQILFKIPVEERAETTQT